MFDLAQVAVACGGFLTAFEALLGTAGVLLAGAIAAVIVAAVLNNGFFSAPASPAAMVTAGLLAAAAAAALAVAKGQADSFFQCMGAPPACAGALSNLLNALTALITVLGIEATACFVAAGFAWIPWAGAAPMYVILAALIIEAVLVPTLIAFAVTLVSCAQHAATASSSSPLITAGSLIAIALVAAVARTFLQKARVRAGR